MALAELKEAKEAFCRNSSCGNRSPREKRARRPPHRVINRRNQRYLFWRWRPWATSVPPCWRMAPDVGAMPLVVFWACTHDASRRYFKNWLASASCRAAGQSCGAGSNNNDWSVGTTANHDRTSFSLPARPCVCKYCSGATTSPAKANNLMAAPRVASDWETQPQADRVEIMQLSDRQASRLPGGECSPTATAALTRMRFWRVPAKVATKGERERDHGDYCETQARLSLTRSVYAGRAKG